MTLRTDCIDAMAKVMARRWTSARPGPDPSPTWTKDAEAALGALLDVLTDEWVEWLHLGDAERVQENNVRGGLPERDVLPEHLLAVLRLPEVSTTAPPAEES